MTITDRHTIRWTEFVSGRGYLMLLICALGASAMVLNTGLHPSLGVGIVVFSTAIVIWVLERLFPHRTDWKPNPRLFGLDLLHTLVTSHGVAPLVRASFVAAAIALGSASLGSGLGVWPTHWPVLFQLLLAIPVADFFVYWAHRAMHRTNWGWRIHAVHHSPTHLYFMAAARSHPLNVMVSVSCQFGVLVLLGIGAKALSLWAVFMALNGLLQHANINFRPRLVSRVLATCDVHRAHHSLDRSNCNYGNNTMIWDQVFGTYRRPPQETEDVGAAGYEIPEHFLTHCVVPFVLPRYEATQEPPRLQ